MRSAHIYTHTTTHTTHHLQLNNSAAAAKPCRLWLGHLLPPPHGGDGCPKPRGSSESLRPNMEHPQLRRISSASGRGIPPLGRRPVRTKFQELYCAISCTRKGPQAAPWPRANARTHAGIHVRRHNCIGASICFACASMRSASIGNARNHWRLNATGAVCRTSPGLCIDTSIGGQPCVYLYQLSCLSPGTTICTLARAYLDVSAMHRCVLERLGKAHLSSPRAGDRKVGDREVGRGSAHGSRGKPARDCTQWSLGALWICCLRLTPTPHPGGDKLESRGERPAWRPQSCGGAPPAPTTVFAVST